MLMLLASNSQIFDDHIMESAAKLALQVRNLMLNYAPIFTVLVGLWGVIRFYFGYEQGGKINFQKYVVYPLVMLFAIIQYSWIMDTVNSVAFDAVNASQNENSDKMFETIMAAEANYQFMVNTATIANADTVLKNQNAQVDAKYGEGSVIGSLAKAKNWVVKNWHTMSAAQDMQGFTGQSVPTVTNIFDFLKGGLQAGFTVMCRTIIILIRKVLFMILLVIGPIAMTFDILPNWRGQFVHWLKIYVGVVLWGLTLNLIDASYVFYINTEYKNVFTDSAELAKQGEYFFNSTDSDFGYVSVVYSLIYLFTPYLTSIYAGGAGAGKVFTVLGGLAVKGIASAAAMASKIKPSFSSNVSGRTKKS